MRANTLAPIKANLVTEQLSAQWCPGEMGVVRVLAPRETSSHAS